MRRLPALAFTALVAATIAAFFITQHLKVSDPLISSVRLSPPAINPQHGRVCPIKGIPRSFRSTTISFVLPDHSDTTGVFVLDESGTQVRALGWQQLKKGKRGNYEWNGREANGSFAPAGNYYVKVVLQKEGRAFVVANHSLQVITKPPRVRVTSVKVLSAAKPGDSKSNPTRTTAADVAAPGKTVISPPNGAVTVHFTPKTYRNAILVVYRSSPSGALQRVYSFRIGHAGGTAVWRGRIHGHAAPPGVYMIGVEVTDPACNLGAFPALPVTGGTSHTGVTVSYLSVVPQSTPVPAGGEASLYVDSHGASYTWALQRQGAASSLIHGSVKAGASGPLNVRIPDVPAGLYAMTIKSGTHQVSVPVVVSAPRGAGVLVVVPALSWQGMSLVDDNGNGLPNTLSRPGDTVALNRPLVGGMPSGFGQEAALLRYLHKQHLHYQVTTDVALAEGVGPTLGKRPGVILDGPFRWIPTGVATALHRYVTNGGSVLSLGVNSLQAKAPVTPGNPKTSSGPTAGPALPLSTDPFGAHHGSVANVGNELITTFADPLKIFGQGTAFTGYTQYQPIAPPTGKNVSLAGVAAQVPAVTGFKLGHGTVVEVGLSGFGGNLHRDDASRELLARVWKLFTG